MSKIDRITVDTTQICRENILIPTREENGRKEKGSCARWIVGYV